MVDSSKSSPPKRRTRGATTMSRFIGNIEVVKKCEVDFDEVTFAPSGKNVAQFISYVSYLAHSKVNINEETWKNLNEASKTMIWQEIMVFYILKIL